MKKIGALFLGLCLSSALFAEDIKVTMPSLGYASTASSGLGGSHVAYTDDIYSLFVNPAALQWANEGMVFDTTIGLTGPLGELVENIDTIKNIGSSDDDSALTSAFKDLSSIVEGGKLPLGLNMQGPLSFGYTANGLGIGLFFRTTLDTRIIGTDVEARVYSDLSLPFGMAFNILKQKDHELAAGFVLKPFARVWADVELSALELMDFDLESLTVPVPVLAGVGGDLGLMYRFKKDLVVGVTAKDVYTFVTPVYNLGELLDITPSSNDTYTYTIPFSLNAGLSYTLRPSGSFYAAFMADWANVQNAFTWNDRVHRNPLLDLGAGVEIGLFGFLKFRAGVHDLLPSVGFGLEPAVFKLNLALYGKELGSEPGVNPTIGAELSISFRPDTKKKNWAWSKPLIK
ncbi:MAG: hypothetical protein LBU00_00285 [Treponema sp.]|jgi:hypothetical protein|nr:hypothetical protein [Treponema sp.]